MEQLTHNQEVDYHAYCSKCINRDTDQGDDPCNECLTEFVNFESRKPVHFEEDLNIQANRRSAKK